MSSLRCGEWDGSRGLTSGNCFLFSNVSRASWRLDQLRNPCIRESGNFPPEAVYYKTGLVTFPTTLTDWRKGILLAHRIGRRSRKKKNCIELFKVWTIDFKKEIYSLLFCHCGESQALSVMTGGCSLPSQETRKPSQLGQKPAGLSPIRPTFQRLISSC